MNVRVIQLLNRIQNLKLFILFLNSLELKELLNKVYILDCFNFNLDQKNCFYFQNILSNWCKTNSHPLQACLDHRLQNHNL